MQNINIKETVENYFKSELEGSLYLEENIKTYIGAFNNILKRSKIKLNKNSDDKRMIENTLFIVNELKTRNIDLRSPNLNQLRELLELLFEKQKYEYKNYFKEIIEKEVRRKYKPRDVECEIYSRSKCFVVAEEQHETYLTRLFLLLYFMDSLGELFYKNFDDNNIEIITKIFKIDPIMAKTTFMSETSVFKNYYSYLAGLYCSKMFPIYSKIFENKILEDNNKYPQLINEFYTLYQIAKIIKKEDETIDKVHDRLKKLFKSYNYLHRYKDPIEKKYKVPKESIYDVLFHIEALKEKNSKIKIKKNGIIIDTNVYLDDRLKKYSRENNKIKLYNHIREQQCLMFEALEKTRKIPDFNHQYDYLESMIAQLQNSLSDLAFTLSKLQLNGDKKMKIISSVMKILREVENSLEG